MKSRILGTAIAAVLLVSSAPLRADDAHHPEAAQPPASAAPEARNETNLKAMQENVTKMQEQLDRIGQAKTDEERRKLMAEHMRTMHENMRMAGGMMGGMGGGMMGGMGGPDMNCPMMGAGKGAMSGMAESHEKRMRQLERRMDRMQMMMQRMMKQRGPGEPMQPGMGKS